MDKNAPKLIDVVKEQAEGVSKQLKTAVLPISERPSHFKAYGRAILTVAGMKGCIRLTLCAKEWIASTEAITDLLGGNSVKANSVAQLFQLFNKNFIADSLKRDGGKSTNDCRNPEGESRWRGRRAEGRRAFLLGTLRIL